MEAKMTDLAATNVSLSGNYSKFGNKRRWYGTATFGNGTLTYPYGGIPVPVAGRFGLHNIDDFQMIDPDNNGISWRYNKAAHKLQAFQKAPPIVIQETVTITAGTTYDTGTTRYPMAWPFYASNGNQALTMLPAGLNPVTTTIAVNMHSSTPGTRATITTLGTDSYTTVTISYVTQAWAEVFENLVEAEIMTAGATTTNGITFTAGTPDLVSFLTAGPFLVGLMVGLKLSTTVSTPKPLQKGQTAAAAEYALDWTNTSPAATTMGILASQAWDAATASIYFNYIKKPATGSFLNDRFVEEDAITSSSNVATIAAAVNSKRPMLWSTPGFMPSVTVSSTSATWPIGGTGMTIGSTAQWQPTNLPPWIRGAAYAAASTLTSGSGVAASLAVKPSFVWGIPDDIETVPLEVPSGFRPKSKTVRIMAWGN